jgi:arylsulfatase
MPTVLDAAGITPASVIDGIEQQPIEGRSLRATFDDGGAPPPRDTQYFEMLGSRAIYHDGWKATTDHVGGQLAIERELLEGSDEFTRDRWALFHLDTDFSEAADLAAAEPERLEGLVQLWDREARRNDVYPLDDTFIGRAAAMYRRRYGPHFRTVLRPGGGPVAEDVAPALGSGFTVTALVDPTDDSTEGVLCAQGNWTNGWAWYVQRGHLVYVFNGYGHAHRIESTVPIPRGARRLEYVYERAAGGGGTGRLLVDGEEVGRGTIPHDLPFRWQIGGAGLTIGYDRGFPVSDDYTPPFPYRGFLHEVVFEIPALAPGTDSILADIGIALLGE